MPTASSLFEDSDLIPPSVEPSNTNASPSSLPPDTTLDKKIFFIQFTPAETMRMRWYLVQIDMEFTVTINPKYASNGDFGASSLLVTLMIK